MVSSRLLASSVLVFAMAAAALAQAPASSAFTYQGRLLSNGQPANGMFDFQFQLSDSETFGLLLATDDVGDVNVVNGLFTVQIDFGAAPFERDARWLAIGVRDGGSAGAYTPLTPRQPLTIAPMALYALAGGYWDETTPGFMTNTGGATFVGVNRSTRITPSEVFGVRSNPTAGSYGGVYIDTVDPNALPFLGLRAGDVSAWLELEGASDDVHIFNGGRRLTVARDGDVGIGTTNPLARLHVDGGARYTGSSGVIIDGPYSSSNNSLTIYTNTSGDAANVWNDGSGDGGVFQARDGNALTATIIGGAGSSGSAVVATCTGTGRAGTFETDNTSNNLSCLAAFHRGVGNAVAGVNTGTGRGGFFEIDNVASTATALYCQTNGTGLALHANGRMRCDVLEIDGGADLSEGFDVSGEVEPGMVVAIDPAAAGKLAVATQAYDKKVAGVISGAGGVKTGMVMGQKDSIADGKHPVALTGRVYVWCDASNGAIEPGDLLTSSDVAGHAMKAVDASRANGATIGKAMTALPSGRGLVLVLVNLQ